MGDGKILYLNRKFLKFYGSNYHDKLEIEPEELREIIAEVLKRKEKQQKTSEISATPKPEISGKPKDSDPCAGMENTGTQEEEIISPRKLPRRLRREYSQDRSDDEAPEFPDFSDSVKLRRLSVPPNTRELISFPKSIRMMKLVQHNLFSGQDLQLLHQKQKNFLMILIYS